MNILLIRNLEIPASVMECLKNKEYRIVYYEDGGESEIKLIKPEKFTFQELKEYLSKGFSKELVRKNITLKQIKELVELGKKTKGELREIQPHGANSGKELTKEQLIYQRAFLADAPEK